MFLEYYLGESNGNATDAARRAGYAEPDVQGPRLLGNVGIETAINARLDEAALKTNEILARLADQATASIDEFLTIGKDGDYRLDLKKARERGKLHLVKSLKPNKYGIGIELHDAQAALVHLGKYRKLFTEKVEHSGSIETVIGYEYHEPESEEAPSLGEETEPAGDEDQG